MTAQDEQLRLNFRPPHHVITRLPLQLHAVPQLLMPSCSFRIGPSCSFPRTSVTNAIVLLPYRTLLQLHAVPQLLMPSCSFRIGPSCSFPRAHPPVGSACRREYAAVQGLSKGGIVKEFSSGLQHGEH
ncbi:hypothetical protein EYF80_045656 [Liparis tanakae]|uniref:Uncharacterized protein n=1 Tax=Liparis tanakae TaxID=230148 RepID=A0A4Z2FSC3_9TELE|nr:hypothetical protein EYF80_045656 [Liparis tanakae]